MQRSSSTYPCPICSHDRKAEVLCENCSWDPHSPIVETRDDAPSKRRPRNVVLGIVCFLATAGVVYLAPLLGVVAVLMVANSIDSNQGTFLIHSIYFSPYLLAIFLLGFGIYNFMIVTHDFDKTRYDQRDS